MPGLESWLASMIASPAPTAPSPSTSTGPSAAPATMSWASVAKKAPPPEVVARRGRGGLVEPVAQAPIVPVAVLPVDPAAPLCVFFLNSTCSRGSSCRFRHVKPSPAAVDFFSLAIAAAKPPGGPPSEGVPVVGTGATSAEGAGGSARGPAIGDTGTPGGDRAGGAGGTEDDDAAFAAAAAAWQESCDAPAAVNPLIVAAMASGVAASVEEAEAGYQVAERLAAADVTCGICFESIVEVPGRRFGLLTGCTHAFCLDCIRQWRGRIDLPKETVRSCPLCRVTSYFIIPCDRYVTDPQRKAGLNDEYHAQQRAIPCRHFNFGKGVCPFGSSCWYAHLNPDGTPAVLPKHSLRFDAQGVGSATKTYKLADFM